MGIGIQVFHFELFIKLNFFSYAYSHSDFLFRRKMSHTCPLHTFLLSSVSLKFTLEFIKRPAVMKLNDGCFSWKESYDKPAAAAAKLLQLCPILCNPIDSSPPGSPVPGILQARTLEWDDISFSNSWKWKVKVKSLRHFRLLATPWTAGF